MSGSEAGHKAGDVLINALPYMGYAINGIMIIIVLCIIYVLWRRNKRQGINRQG